MKGSVNNVKLLLKDKVVFGGELSNSSVLIFSLSLVLCVHLPYSCGVFHCLALCYMLEEKRVS